jgi:ATP-dependent DNA helicase RecQ
LLKVVAVEGAVERDAGSWVATGVPYVYDDDKWRDIRRARAAEADLMRSYAAGRGCLMEFLQRSLDDPDPGPCGRCSVCTSALPAQGRAIAPERVEAARAFLRGVDVVIQPRKMWPARLTDGRKGRITGAGEGRALTFADAPGWQDAASAVAGADAALSDDIVNGMVAVLTRWRSTWDHRPVAIVPMPSRRHDTMIRHLATRIGEIGKLPVVDLLTVSGPRPPDDAPSGPKVEALLGGLALLGGAQVPTDGPLLLIDDSYRSGWTMTVAAAILRESGASAVMPLVVHQLP